MRETDARALSEGWVQLRKPETELRDMEEREMEIRDMMEQVMEIPEAGEAWREGVLGCVWAEAGEAAVEGSDGLGSDPSGSDDSGFDGSEFDPAEGDAPGGSDDGADAAEAAELDEDGEAEPGAEEEKDEARRGSKAFREWLKRQEATPEGQKFAKQVRADFYKAQQIAEIDPEGINGIRQKYALLESIGGVEAVTELQERAAESDALDQALGAGDPRALDTLGPEFDAGLVKLTPVLLERVMRADPEAFATAMLPHLMSTLAGAPLTADLSRMVEVMNAAHLDDKGKLDSIGKLLRNIAQFYRATEEKAAKVKAAPVDQERRAFEQERSRFEQQQQQAHWSNHIIPQVAGHEKQKLEEAFRPYAAKLRLDTAGTEDLFSAFRAKLKEVGQADAAYIKQMGIYHKQKNPDPGTVANFVKAAINRHYKSVVDGVVKARYGRFLGAAAVQQRRVQPAARPGAARNGAPTIVSAKPSPEEIDYRRTPEADQWKGIYTLKDGSRVKWVRPA